MPLSKEIKAERARQRAIDKRMRDEYIAKEREARAVKKAKERAAREEQKLKERKIQAQLREAIRETKRAQIVPTAVQSWLGWK